MKTSQALPLAVFMLRAAEKIAPKLKHFCKGAKPPVRGARRPKSANTCKYLHLYTPLDIPSAAQGIGRVPCA